MHRPYCSCRADAGSCFDEQRSAWSRIIPLNVGHQEQSMYYSRILFHIIRSAAQAKALTCHGAAASRPPHHPHTPCWTSRACAPRDANCVHTLRVYTASCHQPEAPGRSYQRRRHGCGVVGNGRGGRAYTSEGFQKAPDRQQHTNFHLAGTMWNKSECHRHPLTNLYGNECGELAPCAHKALRACLLS